MLKTGLFCEQRPWVLSFETSGGPAGAARRQRVNPTSCGSQVLRKFGTSCVDDHNEEKTQIASGRSLAMLPVRQTCQHRVVPTSEKVKDLMGQTPLQNPETLEPLALLPVRSGVFNIVWSKASKKVGRMP